MEEKGKHRTVRKVTIKIEKKAEYFFDSEKKLLIKINQTNKIQFFDNPNFQFHLNFIVPHLNLDENYLIQKTLNFLHPTVLLEKILQLKKENSETSLKKLINDTEYMMMKQISSTLMGCDDDPSKIYDFLGNVLLKASKELEKIYLDFHYMLVEELKKIDQEEDS